MPLKQINRLTFKSSVTAAGKTSHIIQTQLPSNPILLTTCHGFQDVPKNRDRAGNVVPHASKKFIATIDSEIGPTAVNAQTYLFEAPAPAAPCPDCYYFFAELGQPHGTLNWNSLVYPCPGAIPPGGTALVAAAALVFVGTNFWDVRFSVENGVVVGPPYVGSAAAGGPQGSSAAASVTLKWIDGTDNPVTVVLHSAAGTLAAQTLKPPIPDGSATATLAGFGPAGGTYGLRVIQPIPAHAGVLIGSGSLIAAVT